MTGIRNNIGSVQYSTVTSFTNLVLYLVLAGYTVLFTIHYLKRVAYLAFFTMIAPLIALTYPIDKIKDGQAQAFGMWLKEYIFNALLPVIHVVVYTIFVGPASEFALSNPLYAIVCIGFLLTAEKFFKKMFGFDKATTTGQLGAAAGGALVMNAINKMGQKSGKNASSKANSSDEISGSPIQRYIPAPGMKVGTQAGTQSGSQAGTQPGSQTGTQAGTQSGTQAGTQSGTQAGTQPGTQSGAQMGTQAGMYGLKSPTKTNSSNLAGVKNLKGNYFNKTNLKNGVKTAGRMTRKVGLGTLGAGMLGAAGIVAGAATGDFSNAIKYAGLGTLAGYNAGNRVGNAAVSLGSNTAQFLKNSKDVFKEGKYGTDEFKTRNSINTLNKDRDFNMICDHLGIKDKEHLIRTFHGNGVTDTESIKKALNAGASVGVNDTNLIVKAAQVRKEADRFGFKKEDIVKILNRDGVQDIDKATKLVGILK